MKLKELIDGNEELCKDLRGDDINKMLRGRTAIFFDSIKQTQVEMNEIYVVRNNDLQQTNFKNDIDYEYNEYIKDMDRILEVVDNIDYINLNTNINEYTRQQKGDGSKNSGSQNYGTSQKSSNSSNSQNDQNTNDRNSQSNSSSGFGNGNDGNGNNNDKNRDDDNDENSEKVKEEDKVYKVNEIFTLDDLFKEAFESGIILISESLGFSKTATLLHVQFLMKAKYEETIPFIFYADCKEQQNKIEKGLERISTDTINDILYRLKLLTIQETELDNFEENLLFEKYKKGDVVFLWNNIEEIVQRRRETLLEVLKEIQDNEQKVVEPDKLKNVQWIVSDQMHVKERENFFECPSYSFVRLNNNKVLKEFDNVVKNNCNTITKDLFNQIKDQFQGLEVKFQLSEDENLVSGNIDEISTEKIETDNHFLVLKALVSKLKLTPECKDIIRFVAIEKLADMSEGKKFDQLNILQEDLSKVDKKMLIKSKAFKSVKDYKLYDFVQQYFIVEYFDKEIFNCTKKLKRDQDVKEIALRLQLLIFAIEKCPMIRLTLRDYLLIAKIEKLHEQIVNKIMNMSEFREIFEMSSNAVKISIFHCLRYNKELYEKLGEIAPKCKNDLERFIENENKKNVKNS